MTSGGKYVFQKKPWNQYKYHCTYTHAHNFSDFFEIFESLIHIKM